MMTHHLSVASFIILCMLAACGGTTTGTSPATPPEIPTIPADDGLFRSAPLERRDDVLSDAPLVPTAGRAFYLGEMEFVFDVEAFDEDYTIAPSYGDMVLRVNFEDGVIGGEVGNIRDDDGTRREGTLTIRSFPDSIVRNGEDVFADSRPIIVGPGAPDESDEAVVFVAYLYGLLADGTDKEIFFADTELRGNFYGADGGGVAGTGYSPAILFSEQGFADVEIYFRADSSGSYTPQFATPVLDPSAYSRLTDLHDDLLTDSAAFAPVAERFPSGSASYAGTMIVPVHDNLTVAGRVTIDYDFGADITGTADSFVRSDGAVLDGQLNGRLADIFSASSRGSNPTEYVLDFNGILVGAESDYEFRIGALTTFAGSAADVLRGDFVGSVVRDDALIFTEGGSFVATAQ